MVPGIVLAAGEARRMGREKLLLDLGGKPVLQWVLEAALSSDLDEVLCVVRELSEMEKAIRLRNRRLRWIVNESATAGQSTSIVAGLRAISPQSDGALFLVGDQPMVEKEIINRLLALFRDSAALIVAPVFRGQTRNPVLFCRDLFPELLDLKGDQGGRVLLERNRGRAAFLEWHEESPFVDVDTWEDYQRLKLLHIGKGER